MWSVLLFVGKPFPVSITIALLMENYYVEASTHIFADIPLSGAEVVTQSELLVISYLINKSSSVTCFNLVFAPV